MSEIDSREVFELRNDVRVSKWMVNDKVISWEEHKGFIDNLRSRTDKDYYIVKNSDNEIIGSVNIDYSDNGISERGIFIAPSQHNKGHALRLLSEFYSHARQFFEVKAIFTKVKADNVASLRLEEKLGSQFLKEEGGYKTFILKF